MEDYCDYKIEKSTRQETVFQDGIVEKRTRQCRSLSCNVGCESFKIEAREMSGGMLCLSVKGNLDTKMDVCTLNVDIHVLWKKIRFAFFGGDSESSDWGAFELAELLDDIDFRGARALQDEEELLWIAEK